MKINKFYFFNKNNKMRIIYISKKIKLNFILLKKKKIKVKSKKNVKIIFKLNIII